VDVTCAFSGMGKRHALVPPENTQYRRILYAPDSTLSGDAERKQTIKIVFANLLESPLGFVASYARKLVTA